MSDDALDPSQGATAPPGTDDTSSNEPAPRAESASAAGPVPAAEPPPPVQPRRKAAAVLEFFWRGGALAEARQQVRSRTDQEARLIQYARASAELGSRALNPIDPLRAGDGTPVAALLFRESGVALAALLGHEAAATPGVLETDAARFQELVAPGALPDQLASSAISRQDVRALERVVRALVLELDAPERRVRKLVRQRIVRIGVVLALYGSFVIAALLLILPTFRGPDLAAGRPWTASSEYAGFNRARGECDGKKTAIFFHTKKEQDPWIRYDLGKPLTIRRVEVQNRTDCCSDRAIPLIIEASPDGENWTELARRPGPFDYWTAKFSPTTTRYVRLRAGKETWLHLEGVHIY